MEKLKDVEQYCADTLMGMPYGFSVGGQHFYLYPTSLGKIYLLQRIVESLGVSQTNLDRDVALEALRLAKEKRNECLTIICYHTCGTKEEIFDSVLISERRNLFDKEMGEDDIAALMIITLTSDKTAMLMKHLGIDKEQERMDAVMRVKQGGDKNSLTFGGKSVFGSLIDAACERYGWTKEYVVWGIDYTSLRLMLADKVNSIYCTDDELKKIPSWVKNSQDRTRINGDDRKAVLAAIKSQDWK